jgi:hypothetical protein
MTLVRVRRVRAAARTRRFSTDSDYRDTNGLELDESLTFHDLRVSAFKGANAAIGKLGLFLKSIEQGKVKQGDVLLYIQQNEWKASR